MALESERLKGRTVALTDADWARVEKLAADRTARMRAAAGSSEVEFPAAAIVRELVREGLERRLDGVQKMAG